MFKNKPLGTLAITLTFIITAVSLSHAARGKPEAPVSIESSVPVNVKTGDTVPATISFVAKANLEQLEVSVAPYEGLDVISSMDKTIFQKINKGEKREISVTVRLTAEIGYLSVFARTKTSRGESTRTVAVRFGTPGDATTQRLKSDKLQKTPEGERMILFPGEMRPREGQ